jgi:hypothetical protein
LSPCLRLHPRPRLRRDAWLHGVRIVTCHTQHHRDRTNITGFQPGAFITVAGF